MWITLVNSNPATTAGSFKALGFKRMACFGEITEICLDKSGLLSGYDKWG